MASEPLEQAEVMHMLGPLTPRAMDICAAAMSDIIIGARKGLTRSGPFSTRILACSKRVVRPPMPLPMKTPMSSQLELSMVRPAFLTAW